MDLHAGEGHEQAAYLGVRIPLRLRPPPRLLLEPHPIHQILVHRRRSLRSIAGISRLAGALRIRPIRRGLRPALHGSSARHRLAGHRGHLDHHPRAARLRREAAADAGDRGTADHRRHRRIRRQDPPPRGKSRGRGLRDCELHRPHPSPERSSADAAGRAFVGE